MTPVLRSVQVPFVTLMASDFGGPAARKRCVLGRDHEPWLERLAQASPGTTVLAASAGATRKGTSIAIRRIIRYPATGETFVYVEESNVAARFSERPRPFHVVRCAQLDGTVRFVDVPVTDSRPMGALAVARRPDESPHR